MAKLSWTTTFFYGFAAFASSAKSVPVATLLMLYYNQVMGLPALTVSTILMLSLVLDAIWDPIIGQFSDHWQSRWGRRLPLMYASVIPTSALLFMIWAPPANQPSWVLASYLAVCLIGLRFFDTLFELPHTAAAPELTHDYDERTKLFTVRYIFDAVGGMSATVLAYNVFMRENPDGTGGILSPQGYSSLGIFCAAAVLVAWSISAAGLHRRLAGSQSTAARPLSIRKHVREIVETLTNRSILILGLAAVFVAMGTGISAALNAYWLIYFFGFTQSQISLMALPILLCMSLTLTTPMLARRFGKRDALLMAMWFYVVIGNVPLLARLFSLVPAGSDLLMVLVAVQSGLGTAAMSMVLILFASTISDLVEDAEVRTHRRSEGLLLAMNNFVRKATQGLGTLGAGLMLTIVAFPPSAERKEVPQHVLDQLGWIYVGSTMALLVVTTAILRYWHADRAMHEANLTILAVD